MKAILISIKPKWVAKILNGEKTIEVRKGTALYKAIQKLIDEYGYAEFYVYCTKGREKLYGFELTAVDCESGNIYFADKEKDMLELNETGFLNGKVVFKFRCYKVEEIWNNRYKMISFPRNDYVERPTYKTENITMEELLEKSCLTEKEMSSYLELFLGTAIHISDLEIFDKPKELSEFFGAKQYFVGCESGIDKTPRYARLTKAPQSWCYVEVE